MATIDNPTTKQVRYTYSLAMKRSILTEAYAELRSVKRVARKYNVQPNQLRKWQRHFDDNGDSTGLRDSSKGVRVTREVGGGRKCKFSDELIADLKQFFENSRDEDFSVSLRLMVAQAKLLSPTVTTGISSRAIESRIYHLLKKWDVTWRRGTRIAQNTRHILEVEDEFHAYVQQKIQLLGVDCCDIYNADETNMYFSPQPTSTYAPRGSKTVSIKGADSSSRCTIMLGASMSGKKLSPFVIFKGKNCRSGYIKREIDGRDGYPDGMEFGVQDRAWMDEALMLEWIEKVWKPSISCNKISYLILDECRSHLTAAVRKAFADCNTEVDLIPGGYTSRLQPMDVGLNKPFKGYVRDNFTDWLIENRNVKPTRQDVSKWIMNGWSRVSEQIVLNAFRGSGYIKTASTIELNDPVTVPTDVLRLAEPSDCDLSDSY
jgi:transposase-like protein